MAQITYMITEIKERPSVAPGRPGKTDMLIGWVEDGLRPYMLVMHGEDYSPAGAIRLIEAEVHKHSMIIGHTGRVGAEAP